MADIWNRFEPCPRQDQFNLSLAADVRDPVWFLTRQWQLGEFRGEDAGAPAYVKLETSTDFLHGMSARPAQGPAMSAELTKLPAGAANRERITELCLEPALSDERLPLDFRMALDLSMIFEQLAAEISGSTPAQARALVLQLRKHYSFSGVDQESSPSERARLEFLQEQHFNGVWLARELITQAEPTGLVPALVTRALAAGGAELAPWNSRIPALLADFHRVARDAFGGTRTFGGSATATAATLEINSSARPPASWDSQRGLYSAQVTARSGKTFSISTSEHRPAEWFDLSYSGTTPAIEAPSIGAHDPIIPARVAFKGMPGARWWDFEDETISFGTVDIGEEDTARQLLLDFMLIHGNDWFVIPVTQKTGTLLQVQALEVVDVFGDTWGIESFGRRQGGLSPGSTFSVFELGNSDAGHALLPSVGATLETGEVLEQVVWGRDEMANVVWAVESQAAGPSGRPLAGPDRNAVSAGESSPTTAPTADTPVEYLPLENMPSSSYPYLPGIAAGFAGPNVSAVTMTRAELAPGLALPPLKPTGRLIPQTPTLAECRLPRLGLSISRRVCRARAPSGSVQIWVQREVKLGNAESSTRLAFDIWKH